jgi:hypothetical protein
MNPMACSLLPVLLVAAVIAAFAAATGIAVLLLTASLMAILAALRNSFAHSMFRLSMRDKEVAGLMQRLHLRVRDQSVEPLLFTVGMRRLILSFAIAQYYFRLITYPTMGRVTSTVEPLS